jgi:hypothetical protein
VVVVVEVVLVGGVVKVFAAFAVVTSFVVVVDATL